MTGLYPEIEPYDQGMLAVGDGHEIYWETCGNPEGKPALMLHGGPGSGCTPGYRRFFNPDAYCVVLFDQRNCGRSLPYASDPDIDLSTNTTWHVIADIEQLRERLGIERWLLLGGSWGSTLALAYAERYPERVSEMVVWGVATGRRSEFDWLFRGGVERFFPEQAARLREALPPAERDGDIVEAYSRLLHDPDAEVRRRAAYEWCLWESATPNWPPTPGLAKRFEDPAFALCFARLVTHYVRHNGWLPEEGLLGGAGVLAGIAGVIVNGRYDFQSPIGNAWELQRVWPSAELVVVGEAGHSAGNELIADELVRATDRFGVGFADRQR